VSCRPRGNKRRRSVAKKLAASPVASPDRGRQSDTVPSLPRTKPSGLGSWSGVPPALSQALMAASTSATASPLLKRSLDDPSSLNDKDTALNLYGSRTGHSSSAAAPRASPSVTQARHDDFHDRDDTRGVVERLTSCGEDGTGTLRVAPQRPQSKIRTPLNSPAAVIKWEPRHTGQSGQIDVLGSRPPCRSEAIAARVGEYT
jgi:hypothetical protein